MSSGDFFGHINILGFNGLFSKITEKGILFNFNSIKPVITGVINKDNTSQNIKLLPSAHAVNANTTQKNTHIIIPSIITSFY